ncbi:uncharacterized protein LOC116024115 [Ipomoea triloba]|uniref:uncharacterized protein LOC116024115 n=1 Tax=Ipomoea triloba TaxID=35885 RepID=UPI00125D879C|nr:uncharacterized protein LOC116024115 [Ipomoea triloba]
MKKCNLNAEDRPDIVCRVFQMKLDSLVKEIRTGNLFGVVIAVVYTIEFQKRGLPHAHILIFLERTTTLSTASCMDSFISTEIPDKEVDKEYYNAMEEFMIHGPCGLYKPNSPCMVNKKCSKHFPKRFVGVSSWDDDGYPIYRRRDNGRTVLKNGVQLDSRPTISHSMFTAWFDANKTYEAAKQLAYIDMPTKFVWKKDLRQWHPRKRGFSIGRIFYVPPGSVWHYLAEDAQYNRRLTMQDEGLCLSDEEKKNFALIEIERLLQTYNKSLKDFPHMPLPNFQDAFLVDNRLLFDELSYDCNVHHESQQMERQLIDEQKVVYDTIINDVLQQHGGMYFVYGYGGTGKTFVWKAISAKIRSKGDIVLNVASSGIASLLLPGGRTAHSRFAIPIVLNEDSTCNITQGSHLAELITMAKLIIWDEAPMMHKHCFEALDRTMRDIMRFKDALSQSKTFGGKTVVFGGDFRQILPVIPKGSRQDIVQATINSSYLWESCKVLRLTKNLRLNTREPGVNMQQVQEFATWLAEIGDGQLGGPNDGYSDVEIPLEMLLSSRGDNIATIVDSIFPMFKELSCHNEYMKSRAILAPTLDVVHSINEYMSDMHIAESKTYLSCDTVCSSDSSNGMLADMHTPEFLNGLKASGISNHTLTLKVGSLVMLLRNIDHSLGLCNGTRLVITRLSDHVVEAKIVSGNNAGEIVLIPRMSMTPTDIRLPFKFQRR